MFTAKGFAESCCSLFREGHAVIRTVTLTLILLTNVFAGRLSAQDWAEKMFKTLEHDFGTVARGANTVYRFEITNLYKQTMHISGVRSSCGCTTPTVVNPIIKTHEKAYIVAKFNTHISQFVGRKGATLTVSFAQPYAAEVQLHVHGNIRGDVVFRPGEVQFGSVEEGLSHEQQITVSYAGRDSWRIVDVTNDNDHFEVELSETSRSRGRVTYNLLVRIKDNHPAGFIKDQLSIITNDPRAESQRFPIFVEGRILPEISVTPETLVLGDVVSGESIVRKVVVRGKKPFKILDVNCGDDCFTFKKDEQSKVLHLVEITYRPLDKLGELKIPVRITTDRGANRGATIMVSAHVIAPAETQAATQSEANLAAENARVAGAASK